ncbi:MAG: aldehyde ferredoxin oxidoreductase family protein [Nitrososphaeria archaeon]
MKIFGWHGNVLRVNLSSEKTASEEIEYEILNGFVGGRGLGVKMLYDELQPGVDPLSPENKLVFAVGPVTGTGAPMSGRHAVVSKSPLTGGIFDSNSGGFFGVELKSTGFDAVVMEGRASSPIYVYVSNGGVEIRDASAAWGKDTQETTRWLLEDASPKARVACIGPAGENLVKIACIVNDYHRAAGRGGLGAVLGSKNVKALVVEGDTKTHVANELAFTEVTKRIAFLLKKHPLTKDSLPTFGTSVLVNLINEHGMFPTRNFTEGVFNDAEAISGEKLKERIFLKPYACRSCPVACGRITSVEGQEIGGPEYETLWALGAQCGVNNLEDVALVNHFCNTLGLDTISMGNAIGCAMDLSARGLIDEKMKWGDSKKMVSLVEETAYKRGLGEDLAEGSRALAQKHGAPELAMQVKGLELPAYDPRGAQGQALAYATSNRGGCHLRAYMIGPEVLGAPTLVDRFEWQAKPKLVRLFQDFSAAMDTMIMCRFSSFAIAVEHYARLLSAVVGISFDTQRFLQLGERIWTLERLFNAREGFDHTDDALPTKFLEHPLQEGGSRGMKVHLSEMLQSYYRVREWDEKGNPGTELLARLGLEA